jgi:methionine synthase I (cobalamin-dependent)/5,10-methylenetetrahydrofolate reductase
MFHSKKVIIFDGAIGTALYEKGHYINRPFEELNVNAPDDVRALHREYIEAGADVITSNTFSITRPQLKKFDIEDRQEALLVAALKLAHEARQEVKTSRQVKVGLSVGPLGVLIEPLGPVSREEVRAEYARISEIAVKENFDLYILETFSSIDEIEQAINGIRSVDKARPILASITVHPEQKKILEDFAERIGGREDVEALGMNCSDGPNALFNALKFLRPLTAKAIVVQPNSGYPRQINGRYFYMTSPDYLAKFAKRFAEVGANGVGGCCGTTPQHIRGIAHALQMTQAQQIEVAQIRERPQLSAAYRNWEARSASQVGEKLRSGKKVFTVEIPSPKGVDVAAFLAKIEVLEKAGIDFVNVPDGARASTRVSSLHLASFLKHRGSKVSVIPHFTARDRNLIALQADLLGAFVNGVTDVLLVTGDPPKLGSNKDATAVYDIDAIGMTRLVDCLNRGVSPLGDDLASHTDFGIGVAANPTAINIETEIQRWRYKCEMGADFAITQPIYDPEAYFRWLDRIGADSRPHVVGIWPFVSLRNAEFMANEVPGVCVPPWAIEEMAKAGENKEEARKRGIDIARRCMEKIAESSQGFAVSAPLGRVDMALETLKGFI